MPQQLPRVRDFLPDASDPTVWTFVRPTPGNGLTLLHQTDTEESPRPAVMALRKLRLCPEEVVPFHVHEHKEKVYVALGEGALTAIVFIGNKFYHKYEVTLPGQQLVIPPGCPHALYYRGIRSCEYLVITSTNDGGDIRWEEATEELLLNRHKTAGEKPAP